MNDSSEIIIVPYAEFKESWDKIWEAYLEKVKEAGYEDRKAPSGEFMRSVCDI